MVELKTVLEKFGKQGEKTGWTYIHIPGAKAAKLSKLKTSFRVKGFIDKIAIHQMAILPMGDGNFILPVNGNLRKILKKKHRDPVVIRLDFDPEALLPDEDFLACLYELPKAVKMFESLPKGHQNYFTNWIRSAKTQNTKANRIAKAIDALNRSLGYGEMIREK